MITPFHCHLILDEREREIEFCLLMYVELLHIGEDSSTWSGKIDFHDGYQFTVIICLFICL